MDRTLGPWLVLLGGALVVVGLLAWSGALGWLGRLPGDLRYERDGLAVYVPFTSMLLVSATGSAVLWLAGRFGG